MEKKFRCEAPFDDKNLCDDSLRDDVFGDCYQADDMRRGKSHLIGYVSEDSDEIYFDGIVDAQWRCDSNVLRIELLACPAQENFFSMREDFFKYYEQTFKAWENPANECLVVETEREGNVLYVSFWFETED